MTFDQLQALEMIIEKGSFKAASAHLHKTQPTLSLAIKKLEKEFDILLFSRDAYRPKLTEQGRVFYSWAKQCLKDYRDLATVGKELGTLKVEPALSLVIDPLTRFETIEGIFEECLSKTVPTVLTLRSEILNSGMELLLEQTADFAIAVLAVQHEDIESIPFDTIQLIPCIAPNLLKHEQKTAKEVRELKTQIVVRSSAWKDGNTAASVAVEQQGKKCFVTDHSLKRNLILQGFGWGHLARHEVETELKNGALIEILSPDLKETSLSLHAMRNRRKTMGPVAREIWSRLRERALRKASLSLV